MLVRMRAVVNDSVHVQVEIVCCVFVFVCVKDSNLDSILFECVSVYINAAHERIWVQIHELEHSNRMYDVNKRV